MPVPRHGRGAYLQTLREAAFAQGLCYECTSLPVIFGKRRCEHCLKRHRDRLTAKFAAGECAGLCGRQRTNGRSRCESCLERHREYQRNRRRAAGVEPRMLKAPGTPRVRRKPLSTSAVPIAPPISPALSDPPPAEVDLSKRRAVIAALAARRAA